MQKTRLAVTTLAHFCIDSYATLLYPVLPAVIQRLGLDLRYAGLLGTIATFSMSLSQPLMGLWGDRMVRHYLVVWGMFMAAVFMPLPPATSNSV